MRKLLLALTVLLVLPSFPIYAGDTGEKDRFESRRFILSHPCIEPMKRPGTAGPSLTAPPSSIAIDPQNKDLFKPMTRREMTLLIEVLKDIKKDPKGFKIKDTRGLHLERIWVLAQEILALLAKVHMDETLTALTNDLNTDPDTLRKATDAAKSLDMCVRSRYEGSGGQHAFEEALQMVLDNRAILEQLILQKLMLDSKMNGL